jgi:signal transduction histidine kinase
MRTGLIARTMLGGAVLVAVVAGAFVTLRGALAGQHDSSRLARHSSQVMAAANGAEKLVLDLETGARGYVITRQRRFLEPWQSARRQLPVALNGLVALVADNPGQEARALEIQREGGDYLAEYSEPLVARAKRDHGGAQIVADGEGKRRVDAIRVLFARLGSAERRLLAKHSALADANANRAQRLGIAGLLLCVLLVAAFTGWMARAVVVPVVRVERAARRVARGESAVRVAESGAHELGALTRAFNTMATSLEHSQEELEQQNTELELGAAELEDQQHQLETALSEVRAQRDELERAGAQLAEEKSLVETFHAVGERLAEAAQPRVVGNVALGAIADAVGAEVGALYGSPREGAVCWELLATRALSEDAVPGEIRAGDGLAGRAVLTRAPVWTAHGDGGLSIATLAGPVNVRRELHLPLLHGVRAVGVLSLGWGGEHGAGTRERELVEHLAGQAAVALANAFALQESRRLGEINRAVVDGVRDAITLQDPWGEVLLANPRTRELAVETTGEPGATLWSHAPLFAERIVDPDAFLAATARIAADPDEPTVDNFEFADTGRSFERYTLPVRDETGPIGRLSVTRETTAERSAERLKDDLVATVSHELRTPLASVIGFTELLLTRAQEPETREHHLRLIHREAQRLNALVNDLLDLQRLERGAYTPEQKKVDVAELLHRQAEIYRGQSTEHELRLDLPGGPIVVHGDEDGLARVVANLLSNAIKYSPAGGTVTIGAELRAPWLTVSVGDDGDGIASADQPHVFDRFYRADNAAARNAGGTGLGLALAKEIVLAHGGQVGVESIEGRGSRLWFTLPCADRGTDEREGPGGVLTGPVV